MALATISHREMNPPQSRKLEMLISSQIQSGVLQPGERLGTAKEIAKKMNASFGSVRQSLEVLAAKGLVVRKPRTGDICELGARGCHRTEHH